MKVKLELVGIPKFVVMENDGMGKNKIVSYHTTKDEAYAEIPEDVEYNAGSDSMPSYRSINYFVDEVANL